MIRLLLRLFNIRDFDPCKSCETLKQQLEWERSENKRLTDTLLSIIKPKEYEASPIAIEPIVTTAGLFSRRRAALEAKDRHEAQILREKKYVAIPDNEIEEANKKIEELESELGVKEEGVQLG